MPTKEIVAEAESKMKKAVEVLHDELKTVRTGRASTGLVENIIKFLWWIALALLPLMIVIAGFYFVTAAGDPTKVEKAKGIILYTVIGFIIILLARGFVELLKTLL